MHNSPLKNAEFALTFTETNLRYLLGETHPSDKQKAQIEQCKIWIQERKDEIAKLKVQ